MKRTLLLAGLGLLLWMSSTADAGIASWISGKDHSYLDAMFQRIFDQATVSTIVDLKAEGKAPEKMHRNQKADSRKKPVPRPNSHR